MHYSRRQEKGRYNLYLSGVYNPMEVGTCGLASGVREGGSWLIDNRQTDRQRSATCYEVVSARDNKAMQENRGAVDDGEGLQFKTGQSGKPYY